MPLDYVMQVFGFISYVCGFCFKSNCQNVSRVFSSQHCCEFLYWYCPFLRFVKVNFISWLAENIAEHNTSLIWGNLLFITIISYLFGILCVKLFNNHVLQCDNLLQVSHFVSYQYFVSFSTRYALWHVSTRNLSRLVCMASLYYTSLMVSNT